MSEIEVILVDQHDRPTGKMEKMAVHEQGLLHRAVTVYVFNSRHQLLLQQRAKEKYHCAGLWSNTTCGHPYPQEETQHAAERRLREEMGMQLSLHPVFELTYFLPLSNGLIEHEYGHVYFTFSDELPQPNPEEADAWRYAALDEIATEIRDFPERFTPWFMLTFSRIPEAFKAFTRQQLAG